MLQFGLFLTFQFICTPVIESTVDVYLLPNYLQSNTCILFSIKALCPVYIRKQISHALAYSDLQYGISSFYFCTAYWRNNRVFKSVVRSVMYGRQFFS